MQRRLCKNCKHLKLKIEKLEKQLFVTNRRLLAVERQLQQYEIKIKLNPPIRREIP